MEWDELKDRREQRRLGIFRAMHFKEVATEIGDYIAPHQQTSLHIRRHTQQYQIPHTVALRLTRIASLSAQQSYETPSPSSLLVGPPAAGKCVS